LSGVFVRVEMTENNELNILDISRDQVALLVQALHASPNQEFMNDAELQRLFKLLAVLQSDLYDDMIQGNFSFELYRKQ
jgi:hypothetical protein